MHNSLAICYNNTVGYYINCRIKFTPLNTYIHTSAYTGIVELGDMHVANILAVSARNGLVVSTPSAVVAGGLIPAFSNYLFHVVPMVAGVADDEKIGPVVPYGRIKLVLIVSIYLGPSAIIG